MTDPIEILITIPFSEELVSTLREVSPRLNLKVIKARKPEDISSEVWSKTEVLYTNNVLPDLESAPNLCWIQFHWAGVNHAIDAPILSKPGLVATTLSGAGATKMAEYILMMLLALGQHLPDLFTLQESREWPKDRWERFAPLELRESTVGILGYGSIGRQVARLLHPFGAQVLACKQDAMQPVDSGYTPEGYGDPTGDFVHRLYPSQALRSMLKKCDFVVITVPLTPATLGMIGEEQLAALKPGAFLVDVSRGGVLHQEGLIHALKENMIAGAALDVFPEEPLPEDSPLWEMSNVIVTPHISGVTPNYDQRAVELFVRNLERYIEGESLYNMIDPNSGY
ncbi:D-2-hydroxyacid dehydrogenase [Chloroflexota bacterium]